jgi:hypothetical protein
VPKLGGGIETRVIIGDSPAELCREIEETFGRCCVRFYIDAPASLDSPSADPLGDVYCFEYSGVDGLSVEIRRCDAPEFVMSTSEEVVRCRQIDDVMAMVDRALYRPTWGQQYRWDEDR